MAVFQPKTFPDFFERMLNRVVARTDLTDLEVGGVLTTIIGAVARELDDVSYQMVALRDLWDIDTASGIDLDARAADCNPDEISRNGKTFATGTVIFGRTDTTGDVTIPANTQVAVIGGTPIYATMADVTIVAGNTESASVGVVALAAGADGNIDAADLAIPTGIGELVVPVSGVETVYNNTSCTGGRDEETDAELRERIKAYLRSLSRATPDALRSAVLGLSVDGYGRVVIAQVEELPIPNYGQVFVWIDDGNGTTEVSDVSGVETVIDPAIGGEIRLYLNNAALVEDAPPTVVWKDHNDYSGGGVDSLHTLIEGFWGDDPATYDYLTNYATGKLTINPGGPSGIPDEVTSVDGVAGLQPGDALTAEYTFFIGLIGEAQKVIDGDPADRDNYPGYRAAGVYVQVKAPTVYWQIIEASVVVETGYDSESVVNQVAIAIEQYVNSLSINGDVIFSEMVHAAQEIDGVFDITFTKPDQTDANPNVLIGDGEVARTRTSDMLISGG